MHISIHLMFLLITDVYFEFTHEVNFNTSHVSINRLSYRWKKQIKFISIHLMFLLIRWKQQSKSPYCHFNTSHVSINRTSVKIPCSPSTISIHLMFLLILGMPIYAEAIEEISIHLMFLLIYPNLLESTGYDIFQYISCFY